MILPQSYGKQDKCRKKVQNGHANGQAQGKGQVQAEDEFDDIPEDPHQVGMKILHYHPTEDKDSNVILRPAQRLKITEEFNSKPELKDVYVYLKCIKDILGLKVDSYFIKKVLLTSEVLYGLRVWDQDDKDREERLLDMKRKYESSTEEQFEQKRQQDFEDVDRKIKELEAKLDDISAGDWDKIEQSESVEDKEEYEEKLRDEFAELEREYRELENLQKAPERRKFALNNLDKKIKQLEAERKELLPRNINFALNNPNLKDLFKDYIDFVDYDLRFRKRSDVKTDEEFENKKGRPKIPLLKPIKPTK